MTTAGKRADRVPRAARPLAEDLTEAAEVTERIKQDLETCRDILRGLADLVAKRPHRPPPIGTIIKLLRRYADRLSDGSRYFHDRARELTEAREPQG
jgi:hypothetical protein